MRFIEILPDHHLRPAVFRFIRAAYHFEFNARIINIPVLIVALVDQNDKIHAAAGLRDHSEPYFSECYIDVPVQDLISSISGKPVRREKIVEVASLASRAPAFSIQFMRSLVFYGEELGFDWAFFTSTRRLELLLRRIRLPLITLGEASVTRAPNAELWGTYYETDPRVVAFGRDQLEPFLKSKPGPMAMIERCAHG